jgi:nitrous oxide reductase accessory protein NosL
MNIAKISALSLVLILALAAAIPAMAGTVSCAECGMTVDLNSKFSAKILQGKDAAYFCDIGDLFSYIKRKGLGTGTAQVKDFPSGEWIDADKASYVRAEKKFRTPMGWGIAAFKEKSRAGESGAVMDFAATMKTIQ